MLRYLLNPNLPDSKVIKVIIGETDILLLNKLSELGIEYIISKNNPLLLEGISNHSDLHIFHKGEDSFIMDYSQNELQYSLSDASIDYLVNNIRSPYPEDCKLNAADIGDYIICNKRIIDESIIEYAAVSRKTLINVTQGYTNCSVCQLARNIFITDDPYIYKETIQLKGIKSILISKGSVKLKGMNYGFIGGCCGLIGPKHLFINGDLSKHKDYMHIVDFLRDNDIMYTDIKGKELTDIGGILPVKEDG